MNQDERWRPEDDPGESRLRCHRVFNDEVCLKSGFHYCNPRGQRFVVFCESFLQHYAGPLARMPFLLEDWQKEDLVYPIFGEVRWSDDWQQYVRRYSTATIIMARKNGKSNIAAAIALYLVLGDDEESATIFSAAMDKDQAEMVFKPARRMVELSDVLKSRLILNKQIRRLRDETTNSEYLVIAGDALGNLGHAPHGFILDELLTQPNRDLWDSLRSAEGTRAQALFIAISTETNDDSSFGAKMIDEAEKIQEDPSRAPHIYAWVRKTPMDADPWDESNWQHANPGLKAFKSLESMRAMATEAKEDPDQENSFRQLQLNQRVQQVTRWMPMIRWDQNGGILREEDLIGRECFGGLDLASVTDLASMVYIFPDPNDEEGVYDVLLRSWLPENVVPTLDKATAGAVSSWVRDGHLIATEGDWIDYYGAPHDGVSYNSIHTAPNGLAIHPQIAHDDKMFIIKSIGYDQAQATATAQFMQGLDIPIKPIVQGYGVSPALKEIMRRVKSVQFRGLENPVFRWAADAVEVRRDTQEKIMIVRPDRGASKKRIDPIAAFATAVRMEQVYEPEDDQYTNPFDTVW